jgi:ubiquinone/menaquinone biosynthesis C-methylase UbiE
MDLEHKFDTAIRDAYEQGGFEAFFRWFSIDSTKTYEESVRQGYADFARAILRAPVPDLLNRLYNKNALEIGYGGGRLLLPASRIFEHVIGVDIHSMTDIVAAYMRNQGCDNFELYTTNGKTLPVDDRSIDFVYSFIVFIHLSSPEVFETYLAEISRVLKPGGIASLYFGRPFFRHTVQASGLRQKLWWITEQISERVLLRSGYRTYGEVGANNLSLGIARWKARDVVADYGLRIKAITTKPQSNQVHLVLTNGTSHA